MAQTKYTYSISADTLNGNIHAGSLKKEIQDSAIVTAFDYISSNDDVLDVYFKDPLSTGDKTTLDTIVSAHTGVVPFFQDYVQSFPPGAFEKRKFQSVGPYTTVTSDYIVPNGKTVSFHEFGGSAAATVSGGTKIEVIWNPAGVNEVMFIVSQGSASARSLLSQLGDGVKVVRIKLTNNTAQSETIGAYWIGNE